jgi:hypothetical protein
LYVRHLIHFGFGGSRKPDCVRDRIERLVLGPYLSDPSFVANGRF